MLFIPWFVIEEQDEDDDQEDCKSQEEEPEEDNGMETLTHQVWLGIFGRKSWQVSFDAYV